MWLTWARRLASPFRLPTSRLFNDCCRWWRTLAGVAGAHARWIPRPRLSRHRGIGVADCAIDRLHCLAVGADVQPADGIADIGGRWIAALRIRSIRRYGLEHHPGLNHRQNAPRLVRSAGSQPLSRGQQLWRGGLRHGRGQRGRRHGRGRRRRRGGRARGRVHALRAGCAGGGVGLVRPAAPQRLPFAAPAPSVAPRPPPRLALLARARRSLRAAWRFRRVPHRDHANVARPVAADRQSDAACASCAACCSALAAADRPGAGGRADAAAAICCSCVLRSWFSASMSCRNLPVSACAASRSCERCATCCCRSATCRRSASCAACCSAMAAADGRGCRSGCGDLLLLRLAKLVQRVDVLPQLAGFGVRRIEIVRTLRDLLLQIGNLTPHAHPVPPVVPRWRRRTAAPRLAAAICCSCVLRSWFSASMSCCNLPVSACAAIEIMRALRDLLLQIGNLTPQCILRRLLFRDGGGGGPGAADAAVAICCSCVLRSWFSASMSCRSLEVSARAASRSCERCATCCCRSAF